MSVSSAPPAIGLMHRRFASLSIPIAGPTTQSMELVPLATLASESSKTLASLVSPVIPIVTSLMETSVSSAQKASSHPMADANQSVHHAKPTTQPTDSA